MENKTETKNQLSLKWGTLKSWQFASDKALALLTEYEEIGSCVSVMMQKDTPRQKEIICELVDECDGETIYLEWDGKEVSKQEAKDYVMNYGNKNLVE